MISEESQELIAILLGAAMNRAADDQRGEYFERCSKARYEFLTDREDGRRVEHADTTIVEDAIRRHAVEMLKLSVHQPQPEEVFPAMPYAMATWHLLRINALRAAPLDVAAQQLREEALQALDTNPKGGS